MSTQSRQHGSNEHAVEDLEMCVIPTRHLANDVVESFAWSNLEVLVKDRKTKQPLSILSKASGIINASEMLAIMGPSGSGKTTLLNALARRVAAAGATTTGDILGNGQKMELEMTRNLSTYVEQEDALIGSLTVRETMIFAARLALPSNVTRKEAFRRVDDLISSFGLQSQAHTIVGTPIKKGLSGGQKKRLGVASRLVANPKILFLDEPTSGLDSALSLEVITYIKEIGRRNKLLIIASIHQPSSATFHQFDKLCLLSGGKTCYFGLVCEAPIYFARAGYYMPRETNAAEFYLDLINTDLDKNGEVRRRTEDITQKWAVSTQRADLDAAIVSARYASSVDLSRHKILKPSPWLIPLILLHRSWIKSHRDVVVYGIRIVILKTDQKYIQAFINAIFFGGAFMSFMAIAYVPAFLEDLHTFYQERANGLVGPPSFMVSNFIIGLPFLFLITLVFSIVEYWLSNFRPNASAFFMWVMWLFLDLLAAESLVVLVSCLFPVFVVALAITAFANGLWMCVDGFLVPMSILNPFWKYVFHYIDFQAYVFQGMMVNEFESREYACAKTPQGYQCMYYSDLNSAGKIRGTAVLDNFSISMGLEGTWVGILIGIIAGYRLLAYLVLIWRK
ncbi:P-loop containing nucleoside triphosphate hydrolase protein [Fusarium oxysporum]|nr:P-loop containing nucleoside triphosphate hydrolase protein [Fusarium oxysporum]